MVNCTKSKGAKRIQWQAWMGGSGDSLRIVQETNFNQADKWFMHKPEYVQGNVTNMPVSMYIQKSLAYYRYKFYIFFLLCTHTHTHTHTHIYIYIYIYIWKAKNK